MVWYVILNNNLSLMQSHKQANTFFWCVRWHLIIVFWYDCCCFFSQARQCANCAKLKKRERKLKNQYLAFKEKYQKLRRKQKLQEKKGMKCFNHIANTLFSAVVCVDDCPWTSPLYLRVCFNTWPVFTIHMQAKIFTRWIINMCRGE